MCGTCPEPGVSAVIWALLQSAPDMSTVTDMREPPCGDLGVDAYTDGLTVLRSRGVVGWVAVLILILAAIQVNTALAYADYPLHGRGNATDPSVQSGTASAQANSQSDPPFSGTVFIDPDIITPSDPSTLIDVTYAGRGERTMFDRRPADWVVLDAYLFNARFDDGLSSEIQVNPEFGSVPAAESAANKYARIIGQYADRSKDRC